MRRGLFGQPLFAQFFGQGCDLFAQGFELACVADEHVELHGYLLLRKVGVHLLYDLVIVVPYSGELPVEIIQPRDIFCACRIAFIDPELSSEQTCEDEFRDVFPVAGFFEHLPEM